MCARVTLAVAALTPAVLRERSCAAAEIHMCIVVPCPGADATWKLFRVETQLNCPEHFGALAHVGQLQVPSTGSSLAQRQRDGDG